MRTVFPRVAKSRLIQENRTCCKNPLVESIDPTSLSSFRFIPAREG